MGRRGPAPTPTGVKVRHGETRPSRINRLEPLPRRGAPQMPRGMDEAAQKVWRRVVREMRGSGRHPRRRRRRAALLLRGGRPLRAGGRAVRRSRARSSRPGRRARQEPAPPGRPRQRRRGPPVRPRARAVAVGPGRAARRAGPRPPATSTTSSARRHGCAWWAAAMSEPWSPMPSPAVPASPPSASTTSATRRDAGPGSPCASRTGSATSGGRRSRSTPSPASASTPRSASACPARTASPSRPAPPASTSSSPTARPSPRSTSPRPPATRPASCSASPGAWPSSPPASSRHVTVRTTLIECPRNGGIMRSLSADAALQHGLNPYANIIDELHAHRTADLYTALTTGTGAREQPFTLWISTAGVDGPGILSELHASMFDGPGELEERGSPPGLPRPRQRRAHLVVRRGAGRRHRGPRGLAGRQPRLLAARRPVPRPGVRPPQGARCAPGVAPVPPQPVRGHRGSLAARRRLDAPAASATPIRTTRSTASTQRSRSGVGIDKGQTSDLSAIVVAQRQGDRVVVRSRVFPPHPATGRVNTESMRVYLRDLRGRFPVPQARDEKTGRALQGPAFAYDRWAFSESAETLEQEGLAMVDFPQNATTMGPASTQAFELITTGRLAHDGDPVLAEHVANTTAILTERGMKVTKPKKVTPRKNDACVALVMAVAMAMQEAPKPFVRTPRVAGGLLMPDTVDLRTAPAGSPEWWLARLLVAARGTTPRPRDVRGLLRRPPAAGVREPEVPRRLRHPLPGVQLQLHVARRRRARRAAGGPGLPLRATPRATTTSGAGSGRRTTSTPARSSRTPRRS